MMNFREALEERTRAKLEALWDNVLDIGGELISVLHDAGHQDAADDVCTELDAMWGIVEAYMSPDRAGSPPQAGHMDEALAHILAAQTMIGDADGDEDDEASASLRAAAYGLRFALEELRRANKARAGLPVGEGTAGAVLIRRLLSR